MSEGQTPSRDTGAVPRIARKAAAPAADDTPSELVEARALIKASRLDDAVACADAYLERAPNDHWRFATLNILAEAYQARFEEHIQLTIGHEMVAINPGSPDGFVHVASAGMVIGRLREAIEAIDKGLTRHPQSHVLMALKSVRFARIQDAANALDWAERAAAVAPDDADVLVAKSLALSLNSRMAESKQVSERAQQLMRAASDMPTIAANVAFCDGRFREAYAIARGVVADNPQDRRAKLIWQMSRVFKSPLLAPYFATFRLGKMAAIALGGAVLAGLGLLYVFVGPWTSGAAAAAITVYYLGCFCVCALADAIYDPRRARRT